MAWSDAKVLLEYRRGDLADAAHERFLAESAPRLASFSLIQALSLWHSRDYWGAMKEFTKAYALIQAGARQGLAPLIVQSEIFPGMSEPDYLRAPWYDWAVVNRRNPWHPEKVPHDEHHGFQVERFSIERTA